MIDFELELIASISKVLSICDGIIDTLSLIHANCGWKQVLSCAVVKERLNWNNRGQSWSSV